jgi:hypothetical protein
MVAKPCRLLMASRCHGGPGGGSSLGGGTGAATDPLSGQFSSLSNLFATPNQQYSQLWTDTQAQNALASQSGIGGGGQDIQNLLQGLSGYTGSFG